MAKTQELVSTLSLVCVFCLTRPVTSHNNVFPLFLFLFFYHVWGIVSYLICGWSCPCDESEYDMILPSWDAFNGLNLECDVYWANNKLKRWFQVSNFSANSEESLFLPEKAEKASLLHWKGFFIREDETRGHDSNWLKVFCGIVIATYQYLDKIIRPS